MILDVKSYCNNDAYAWDWWFSLSIHLINHAKTIIMYSIKNYATLICGLWRKATEMGTTQSWHQKGYLASIMKI